LLSGNDDVNIKLSSNHISLNAAGQKSMLHFCSPILVPTFSGTGPKVQGDPIYTFKLDDDWINKMDKIQRIASKFKKIYFVVKDGKVLIEATDKLNNYSNGLELVLGDTTHLDVSLCFDFKSFSSVFKVLGSEYEDFTMTVSTMTSMNAGLISFINDNESEKYFILSKEDTE
jgi:hypothetical protein